jgi:glyoxylase-like metal-dependent hydrolase (beta-lactamase superfamily II)
MTLEGTNTYIVGRDPAIVIDPGPADRGHIEAVHDAAGERGGVGAVLLTHTHGDHSDGVEMLGVPPTPLADGETYGPLTALATPGHAKDHIALTAPDSPDDNALHAFVGDLILGEGSTFVPPRAQGGRQDRGIRRAPARAGAKAPRRP